MENKEFKAISGVELMMMEFPRQQYCVQDILPDGLSILSSENMDIAKSLAMDISLRVASGQELWDMESRKGAVLHLIHQDTLAVTRNQIMRMTRRIPDNLYIGVMTESSLPLAISAIPGFIEKHPDASLVVIELDDAVALVEGKLFATADTLLHYNRLKEMTEEYGIAVLVVLRQLSTTMRLFLENDEKPACISDIIDSGFNMEQKWNNPYDAELHRSSREFGNASWEIQYSKETHKWERKAEK